MMEVMKPEVIRYQHIENILEGEYLKKMGEKLFGNEFKGFVKETTFMHSAGFLTRKVEPIKSTPAKEFRKLTEACGLTEKDLFTEDNKEVNK